MHYQRMLNMCVFSAVILDVSSSVIDHLKDLCRVRIKILLTTTQKSVCCQQVHFTNQISKFTETVNSQCYMAQTINYQTSLKLVTWFCHRCVLSQWDSVIGKLSQGVLSQTPLPRPTGEFTLFPIPFRWIKGKSKGSFCSWFCLQSNIPVDNGPQNQGFAKPQNTRQFSALKTLVSDIKPRFTGLEI